MPSKAHILFCELDPVGHERLERVVLPLLAPDEQARYRSFSSETRRHAWLTGRELLLAAHVSFIGEPDTHALLTDSNGGVRYAHGGVYLNLSHSGGLFAAAISDVPVGVDIERIRPRAVTTQAARVFCAGEAAALQRGPDPLAGFYRLWTLKEAACKAVGLSIWDALGGACFDLEAASCRLDEPFPSGPWRFMYAGVAPDWRLGLALRSGGTVQVDCFRRRNGAWEGQALMDMKFVAAG